MPCYCCNSSDPRMAGPHCLSNTILVYLSHFDMSWPQSASVWRKGEAEISFSQPGENPDGMFSSIPDCLFFCCCFCWFFCLSFLQKKSRKSSSLSWRVYQSLPRYLLLIKFFPCPDAVAGERSLLLLSDSVDF